MPFVSSAVAGPDLWVVFATFVIPLASILIPTIIAVWLAANERKAGAKAREEEKLREVTEGVIEVLTFFVSVNPAVEDWADRFRALRARTIVLQTLPGRKTRIVGEWLAAECRHGSALMTRGSETLNRGGDQDVVEATLRAMAPAHQWAHQTIMFLANWMRGEVEEQVFVDRYSLLSEHYPAPDEKAASNK